MILNTFMLLYRLLWVCLLPILLIYLKRRGRKDPLYGKHIFERFGFYAKLLPQNPIWFHTVSLGELRSAVALIQAALQQGDSVLITTFTPTGRREAERQFSDEIAQGQVAVVWVPFDMNWCHRRLIRACAPKICLPLEVEIWPAMIDATRRAGVPLYLCNAQYASKPLKRDSRGLRIRQRVIARCAGAFVKSETQKKRFASVGLTNLHVTGELRFDQPIPESLTSAAAAVRPALADCDRQIIAIASGVEVEEDIYADMICNLRDQTANAGLSSPLFVYVPRAPERFDGTAELLQQRGLNVARRSQFFGAGVEGIATLSEGWPKETDVLLGDSLGEMYFYLSLADKVIIGAGFSERGAHNIIEPLSVGKPVYVGPYTWTIEFPFLEAQEAKVARSFKTPEAMQAELAKKSVVAPETLLKFVALHRGASVRTLEALNEVVRRER